MHRITTSLVAAATCSLVAGSALAQGRPDIASHIKDGSPPAGSPEGTQCFKISTTNAGLNNPFNRLCIEINQVAAAPHPMEGRVALISAKRRSGADSAGWEVEVDELNDTWQLCFERPTNEVNNIDFKICIQPNVNEGGRRREATLTGSGAYRYFKVAGPQQGGSGSGSRRPSLLPWAASAHPADLNGDGVVDGADLGLLLSNWGGGKIGDLNGDGVIDGADLGVLLSNWGTVEEEAPCDDAICLEAICQVSPLCCDLTWDLTCDWLAHDLCGCDEPADLPWQTVDQSCVDAGEMPGCEDPLLVACVCSADQYCCSVQWDSQCAMHALVECNAAGVEFAVYDTDMVDLTSGDLIVIRGVGFPEDANDLHLSIRPWMPKPDDGDLFGSPNGGGGGGDGDGGLAMGPATGSRLSIISVTPTSVVAQVRGVAPSVPVGMIVAQLGSGVATIPAGLPSVLVPTPPGILYWSALQSSTVLAALHAVPLMPVPSTPSQCVDNHGGLIGNALTITLAGIPDPLPAGSTLDIDVDGALMTGGFQFAQQMTLTTSGPMSITQTANAICATLNLVFFQQTGQFFPCTSQVLGLNSVQISVEPPFGDAYDPNQFNAFWLRVCEP